MDLRRRSVAAEPSRRGVGGPFWRAGTPACTLVAFGWGTVGLSGRLTKACQHARLGGMPPQPPKLSGQGWEGTAKGGATRAARIATSPPQPGLYGPEDRGGDERGLPRRH